VKGFLLDTNVLSELTKRAPSAAVESFLRASKDRVFVSVLSIGEIRKGIASLPVSGRRAELVDWLDNEILPWLAERVLPVTLEIAEYWGELAAQSSAKGRPRAVIDALLAATAARHDFALVTRNVRDYEDLGISILNPWAE
jgi:toxin FitB